MNNFQKHTKDIDSLIKFLLEITNLNKDYLINYLQEEAIYEKNN